MAEVTDNTEKNRYELLVDGHLSIADYYKKDNVIAITHVEVPPALRGKGVAAQLMAGVVVDANAKKLRISPICPYAVTYLQKNPQKL